MTKRQAVFFDECGEEFVVPLKDGEPIPVDDYPECQFRYIENVRDYTDLYMQRLMDDTLDLY